MKKIRQSTVITKLEELNAKLVQTSNPSRFELARINTAKYGIFCVFKDYKALYFQNNRLCKLFYEFLEYTTMVNLRVS